jgi:hypothetical protein
MMKRQEPFDETSDTNQVQASGDDTSEEFASTLAQVRSLDAVPERNPAHAQAGRRAFLTEASKLRPAVSSDPKSRHMGWTNIFRKERSPMFTLARIVLLAALALGGTGVTAYAAQESLPDQALYPVKTWIEDVRLGLASGPQADFDLLLNFIEERIEEIETLVAEGQPVPTNVATRLQLQLQQMTRLAAEMEDPAMLQAMEQVHERSQIQIQILEKLRLNAPEDMKALELATQAMHNIRNAAEDAIQDPLGFRLHQGTNRPDDAPEMPDNQTPNGIGEGPGDGQGQGPQGPQEPKKGNGAGQ